MRTVVLVTLALAVSAGSLNGQVAREIQEEYQVRILAADSDSATAIDHVLAAEAARFLRKYEEAGFYIDRARVTAETEEERNAILTQRLWYALATGDGVEGVQALFRAELEEREIPPVVVAGWINAFPELLVGGEYDALIDGLSIDATDPLRRCECFAPKAWRYRAAGDMARSKVYWDSLNVSRERRVPDFGRAFDEADWRAQLARNYARAGRTAEARAELGRAMSVDIDAFESVTIRRRRAQTYAELGDVDEAVADLAYLLSVPSPVTTHSLGSRLTWAIIRDDPAFQALLRTSEP